MEELLNLCKEFYKLICECDKSNYEFPDSWENEVVQAIEFKRSGEYVNALKIYYDLTKKAGIAYLEIVYFSFKVIFSGGLVSEGLDFLVKACEIYDENFTLSDWSKAAYSNHLLRIKDASIYDYKLFEYAEAISGSSEYKPLVPIADMRKSLEAALLNLGIN